MKYDIGITNAIMLSAHNNYVPRIVSVGITGDRIAKVSDHEADIIDCQVLIDGEDKILMPGLVNGHCHGDMTFARGLGDDLTLSEQNKSFASTNWFYSLINDEDRYYSRQLTYCEALLSGTTFIAENMYWSLGSKAIKAMQEVGIKGALVEDVRKDFSRPKELVTEEQIAEFISGCKAEGLIPVLGTISEEDFDTELLNRIKKMLMHFGIKQTCHLAENTWRVQIVKGRFQKTPVDYLYHNGFLNDRLIGSHMVHVSEEELSQLAEKGVKVVNTPLCEMKICDGVAPVPDMVRKGITVCLGTDGALWNNSNDIFREMKGLSLLHTINSGVRSIGKKDILNTATINGYKSFGIERDYGTVEEGKKASLILIETRVPQMRPLRLGDFENVTSHVIYNATGSNVTDVLVDGNHLVKEKRLLYTDINFIIRKAEEASEKVVLGLRRS